MAGQRGRTPRVLLLLVGGAVGQGGCGAPLGSESAVGALDDDDALSRRGPRRFSIDRQLTAEGPPAALVASPWRRDTLVLATMGCQIYRSGDGGATWSGPSPLPVLGAGDCCDHPALAFGGDGRRLYYVHVNVAPQDRWVSWHTVVVGSSSDGGRSFDPPVDSGLPQLRVFPGKGSGGAYEALAIAAPRHPGDHVYVGAQWRSSGQSGFPPFARASFVQSAAAGAAGSFTAPLLLEESAQFIPDSIIAGIQVKGGRRGDVLVAWQRDTTIHVAASADHGATFAPPVTAAARANEAPALAIDDRGGAHMVFSAAPLAAPDAVDRGDIFYVRSAGPPYDRWSAPSAVSDDLSGCTQRRPALQLDEQGRGARVQVVWEDQRLAESGGSCQPGAASLYDVFTSSTEERGRFARDRRLSTRSSPIDTSQPSEGAFAQLAAGLAVWADGRGGTYGRLLALRPPDHR